MRFSKSIFYAALMAVPLAGCYTSSPDPMPRGYSSYDQVYKSVPGQPGDSIGYDYSNENNNTVIEDMRYAAQDLVAGLDQKLSFSVDEVYLVSNGDSAFYNSFDHLLRHELTQQGYLLAHEHGEAVRVDFVAQNGACKSEGMYQSVYLALAINTVDDEPSDVVGGYYEVPVYGMQGKTVLSTGGINVNMPPCLDEMMEE